MAETAPALPVTRYPNPGYYLRFKPAESRKWVRRNLFSTGWSPCWRYEEATAFDSREEAEQFARLYKLTNDVELLTVTAEGAHAA